MTTISPASSDQPKPSGTQDPWSTRPLAVTMPPDRVLYAVSGRTVTGGTVRPNGFLLAALLVLFALLNIGDLASTYVGLVHGLAEGNPLMSQLLAHYGFGALIADKVFVVTTVSCGAFLLRKLNWRMAHAVAVICDALVLVVVLANIVQYALTR